jgi:hypothetical protein
MGNVHGSLLKSLNQRKLSIFWCTRFLQNSWQNRVGGTQLRHALTSLFRIPARTFESQCIMYCLWTSGCHYIHIHFWSTRNMLNGLILQRNPNCYPTNWMACVLCQYYFGVDTAYFLQKGELNWYNIIAFNVPFDSTASTPFIWVHTPAAERIPTRRRKVKQIWGL